MSHRAQPARRRTRRAAALRSRLLAAGLALSLATAVEAQPPPNDLCADALPVSFGVSVAGTTIGATFDPAAAARGACPGAGPVPAVTAPGTWYSVVGTDRLITATTCPDSPGASATFDTKISVYCAGCSGLACILGSDDDCVSDPSASEVSWCSAAGEEYLIFVHGQGAQTGDYQLLVTQGTLFCRADSRCTAPPATCDGSPAAVIEAEPDCGGVFNPGGPGDTVNGGCDAAAPAFTSVAAGDDVCAGTGSDGATADSDWYELVLTEASRVTACAGSPDADLLLGLVATGGSGDCADAGLLDPSLVVSAGTGDCLEVDLAPGTWWFRIEPVGGAFVACETEYAASFDALPLGDPGGCCDRRDGTCAVVFAADCADEFLGAGSDCAGCRPPCEASTATVLEDEPACGRASGGPDAVNGGCDEPIPTFTRLLLGDRACATTAALAEADADWFEITLLERTRVTTCVEADAALLLGLVPTGGSGDCADAGAADPVVTTTPGTPTCLTLDLEAGTWWWRVDPAPGSSLPCPTEYELTAEGLALGEPGGCCEPRTGDCGLGFEADCPAVFLGPGSDCSGCVREPCLYRATSGDLDPTGLFVSPRRADGIAFATPFDAPHACPLADGDADPEPVLRRGAPPLAFYQLDDPALSTLRLEKDEAAETIRFRR